MKKIFFIGATILSALNLSAQEPADALRYAWNISGGTARQQAIGGAMASLGGEISSTFYNPAGLAFFKTGDFVISPGYHFLNNKSTYFNNTEKDQRGNLFLGTTGFVLGDEENFKNRRGKTTAFSIAVNRAADFNSEVFYSGLNNQSSYSQKFLEEIDNSGINDANIIASSFPFGTSLAFNTFWIDTAAGYNSGNRDYVSLAQPLVANGLIQENRIINKGGIMEFALGAAGTLNDKWFLGGTIGVPSLRHIRESTFSESDPSDVLNNFESATISEYLKTTGVGINMKLGVIYKPVEHVRLGLALHSPTFYRLTDRYSASVTTNTENYQGSFTQSSTLFTDGVDAESKYWHFTPYKIMFGASYVLREIEDVRRQKGFLTADIEYINYKASSYTTDTEGDDSPETRAYYKELNTAIDNAYKGAFNFRVGGELKFTTWMVRLGGAYYGNPYKDLNGEKGHRLQVSGGLGYRHKGIFIDAAYAHMMGKDIHYAYRLQNGPFTAANIKNTGGTITLTFGVKI